MRDSPTLRMLILRSSSMVSLDARFSEKLDESQRLLRARPSKLPL